MILNGVLLVLPKIDAIYFYLRFDKEILVYSVQAGETIKYFDSGV
ncbi:MAG: hypothetical protein IRD7MM_05100 [Candidatus Midichloria mitochondrii]